MLKQFHGRWKHLPEVVVNVSAETASKARYLIYLKAREAYPEVKLTEIQVRSGQFFLHPLVWDDNANGIALLASGATTEGESNA